MTDEWERSLVEKTLTELTDDEFSALVNRTRPPPADPSVDLEARKAAANAALVRRARGVNTAETTQKSADEARKQLDHLFSRKGPK